MAVEEGERLAAGGLDWMYVAFDVPAGDAARALEAMRTLGIAGLSVTTPHKEAVAAAVDALSPAASTLRSGVDRWRIVSSARCASATRAAHVRLSDGSIHSRIVGSAACPASMMAPASAMSSCSRFRSLSDTGWVGLGA